MSGLPSRRKRAPCPAVMRPLSAQATDTPIRPVDTLLNEFIDVCGMLCATLGQRGLASQKRISHRAQENRPHAVGGAMTFKGSPFVSLPMRRTETALIARKAAIKSNAT